MYIFAALSTSTCYLHTKLLLLEVSEPLHVAKRKSHDVSFNSMAVLIHTWIAFKSHVVGLWFIDHVIQGSQISQAEGQRPLLALRFRVCNRFNHVVGIRHMEDSNLRKEKILILYDGKIFIKRTVSGINHRFKLKTMCVYNLLRGCFKTNIFFDMISIKQSDSKC